jgi:hypothetical protein
MPVALCPFGLAETKVKVVQYDLPIEILAKFIRPGIREVALIPSQETVIWGIFQGNTLPREKSCSIFQLLCILV